ncbi:hypothetical protein BU24DRAFT_458158 [Aaosphaeria arxii CBS 175.79]|uniref:Ubiquitin 3 binding protein But2 C-terminal domain-containing protein n=1 Tax=Aaosphaeria arxii CBS 175.79 TaxID=1450172 RepID=A0A6A5YCI1_9PLEO|nr:uncharacterized protein BU24DRAFT_458158 [Aaosphaeria arxii CBS 175.79]KAF2022291.1 hypothetical protein BU24DRAFT_458158 [Aaosphaeria arxii CBS 175.79]
MRLILLILPIPTLFANALAASRGKGSGNGWYNLQIIGGNPIVNAQKLQLTPAGHLIVIPPPSPSNTTTSNTTTTTPFYATCTLEFFSPSPRLIHCLTPPSSDPYPPPTPPSNTTTSSAPAIQTETLILQGPSGKGEHQLRQSTTTLPFGIGSTILFDDWIVVTLPSYVVGGSKRRYLRYRDETLGGGWVASRYGAEWMVRGHEGDGPRGGWAVWWQTPSAANMLDLGNEAVGVGVELVEVEVEVGDEV